MGFLLSALMAFAGISAVIIYFYALWYASYGHFKNKYSGKKDGMLKRVFNIAFMTALFLLTFGVSFLGFLSGLSSLLFEAARMYELSILRSTLGGLENLYFDYFFAMASSACPVSLGSSGLLLLFVLAKDGLLCEKDGVGKERRKVLIPSFLFSLSVVAILYSLALVFILNLRLGTPAYSDVRKESTPDLGKRTDMVEPPNIIDR